MPEEKKDPQLEGQDEKTSPKEPETSQEASKELQQKISEQGEQIASLIDVINTMQASLEAQTPAGEISDVEGTNTSEPINLTAVPDPLDDEGMKKYLANMSKEIETLKQTKERYMQELQQRELVEYENKFFEKHPDLAIDKDLTRKVAVVVANDPNVPQAKRETEIVKRARAEIREKAKRMASLLEGKEAPFAEGGNVSPKRGKPKEQKEGDDQEADFEELFK